MSVTTFWYGQAISKLANEEVNWDTDTIKVSLHSSGYTPDRDGHTYQSDLTNEVSGTGYVAGGETIANTSVSYNSGTNLTAFDGDDVTWSGVDGFSARYGVIYDATPGTSGSNPLLGYVDFGEEKSPTTEDIIIKWNSKGILFTKAV